MFYLGLKARSGLFSWYVCEDKVNKKNHKDQLTKDDELANSNNPLEMKESAEDLFDIYRTFDQLPDDYKGPIRSSMFADALEKMKNVYKIQNTVRILPHDQNTSGFYLALFRKKDHVVFDNEDSANNKNKGQDIEENKKEVEQTQSSMYQMNDEKNDNVFGENQKEEVVKTEKNEEEKVDYQTKSESNPSTYVSKKKLRNEQELSKKLTFEDLDILEWKWIQDYYGIEDEKIKDLLIQQTQGDRKVLLISPGIKKVLDLEKNKSNKFF